MCKGLLCRKMRMIQSNYYCNITNKASRCSLYLCFIGFIFCEVGLLFVYFFLEEAFEETAEATFFAVEHVYKPIQ